MKLDLFFKFALIVVFFIIASGWAGSVGWLYAITWASVAGGFATFTTYATEGWNFSWGWSDIWLNNFIAMLMVGVALDAIFWVLTLRGWL